MAERGFVPAPFELGILSRERLVTKPRSLDRSNSLPAVLHDFRGAKTVLFDALGSTRDMQALICREITMDGAHPVDGRE
jgi:hypothetical protein